MAGGIPDASTQDGGGAVGRKSQAPYSFSVFLNQWFSHVYTEQPEDHSKICEQFCLLMPLVFGSVLNTRVSLVGTGSMWLLLFLFWFHVTGSCLEPGIKAMF